MRHSLPCLIFCIALLVIPWHSAAQQVPGEIKYEVQFQGVEDAELREWLENVSTLKQKKETSLLPFGLSDLLGGKEELDHLPRTRQGLEKEAREDLPRLLSALHARGYYSATLRLEFKDIEPVQVIYQVAPATQYRVASETIALMPPTPADIKLPDLTEIKPSLDKPTDAEVLQEAAQIVRNRIAESNCLLSVKVEPTLQLEPASHSAHVYFEVTTGPKADFGELHIVGNESVRKRAIRRMVPWQEGDCFHDNLIDQAQAKLLESGLFATSEVLHADTPGPQGRVPVTVEVDERFHRTVKAGVSYMTDEGVGASAGWEHRNLLGGGEKLDALGVISTIEYSLESHFAKPYFLRPDQSLKLGARIAHEEPDAYVSDNTSLTAMIERELNDNWNAGAGIGYRLSQVEDAINGNETYGLVSLPVYGAYDSRDDILDPKDGIFARLDGFPYFDTLGSGSGFFKTLFTGSTYFELPGAYEPVLALRGALGSISGASRRNIPADVRFYAGGGSSVRGYGYQELSPTLQGEPIGGRSLLETSFELRFKATEDFGGAVFLDGGNAFESEYPDFKQSLRWGAGAGVRYFSALGPLRLDIAVPLNRRASDDAFQLYVSLGQAF